MNWIYEGVSGLVDKEEYLTGRKVDKTFEIAQLEKDGGNIGDFNCVDNNIPSLLESTGQLRKLDLDFRLKEDPLQDIKRKETEIIKEILNNPIKMKKMKNLLEESLRKEKEEKKMKKKLKKKAKKLKKQRDRSKSRSESINNDRKKPIKQENVIENRFKRERSCSSEISNLGESNDRKHKSTLKYNKSISKQTNKPIYQATKHNANSKMN